MADTIVKNIKIRVETDGSVTFKDLQGRIVAVQKEGENLSGTLKRINKDFRATESTLKAQSAAQKKLRNETALTTSEYQKQTAAVNVLDLELEELRTGASAAGAAMSGVSAASGGATATVLEAGRAISDSNYGIRGMANNLSQLATNFAFTTRAAGGFTGGIKALWTAITGPIGIILAINTLLALWERFEIQASKTKDVIEDQNKAMKEATSAAKVNIVELETYARVIKENEEGTEKHTAALKKLTDEGYDPASEALDDFIEKQKELIIVEATAGVFKEQLTKLIEADGDAKDLAAIATKKLSEATASQAALEERISKGLVERNSIDVQRTFVAEKYSQALEAVTFETERRGKVQDNINAKAKEYSELIEKLLESTTKAGRKGKETNKVFKKNLLDLEKIILDFNRKDALLSEENEQKKADIQELYEQQDLKRRKDSFIEREQQRLDNFLASKASEEEKQKARVKFRETELQAEEEYQVALTALINYQTTKRFEDNLQSLRDFTSSLNEEVQSGQIIDIEGRIREDSGVDALNTQNELLARQHENKLFWIDQEIEERKRSGKVYGDLMVQRFNAVKKFNQDSVELARKTEQFKIGIITQGLEVANDIAAEGSAVQKATSVAIATISTYEAANAALGAKPWGAWNIAQAAIVTAAGLSNVQKILATKTPNEKSVSSPNVNTGRTFDFNLVGSTNENQLAAAVGQSFTQPVRAYVVSSEITDQAELDLQIESSASLGD